MARRGVISTSSRIFTRQRSAPARWFGAGLLTLCLLVTAWGLGTAVYLERSRDAAPPAVTRDAPPALVPAPASESEPVIRPDPIAATLPAPEPTPALVRIEPQAGAASVPAPSAIPPQAAPPAAPVPTAKAAPRYWVEYGVYAHRGYARRLQQALARHGLAASIVRTRTPQGRVLLRVRSAAMTDEAAARAAGRRAAGALEIGTLLHRSAPALAAKRYWVQFGAFPQRRSARHLEQRLRRGGIAATVSSRRGVSGKPFYLVRSLSLLDHSGAVALGERGERVSKAGFLVGEHPPAARRHARAPPAARRLAASG